MGALEQKIRGPYLTCWTSSQTQIYLDSELSVSRSSLCALPLLRLSKEFDPFPSETPACLGMGGLDTRGAPDSADPSFSPYRQALPHF